MKRFQVTVNGNSYQVEVEELPSGQTFNRPVVNTPVLAPMVAPVQVVAPAQTPVIAPVQTPAPVVQSGTTGTHKVNAPMQGKIVGVKVAVGDVVKQNDVLILLEAMKMENEIVSPVAGTIASIHVSVGQTAETAELLVSLN